jgi:hypothetical protein
MSAMQIPTATPPPSATSTAKPTPTPSPTSTVPTAADVATVVQATVNLRAEPDGAVIGALAAGDSVTVIECVDSWCKIETDVLGGWIYQGCLSLETELECQAK